MEQRLDDLAFKGGFSTGKYHKPSFGTISPSESCLTSTSAHYISYRWGRNASGKRPVGLWQLSLWERIFVLKTKSLAIFASGEVLRYRI